MTQAPVKGLQLPFCLFLLYPCFPLKYLFLNSRVECSVNHPPSSALLTPSSYCCCFCSVAKSYLIFATPWTAARQAPLSLEFAETHVHWVCDAIQPSHPLSSPSLPAFSISQHQGLFQWVSCLHQVAKVLELPMNSHSWFSFSLFDLLAVQGTLKSLLQHHSLKASVLHRSAFFMVQLSHPYSKFVISSGSPPISERKKVRLFINYQYSKCHVIAFISKWTIKLFYASFQFYIKSLEVNFSLSVQLGKDYLWCSKGDL